MSDLEDGKTTSSYARRSPPAPGEIATASGRGRLVVLYGKQPGRKYPLDAQSTIGRASTCTVQLEDTMVSRKHAIIERLLDGTWLLIDLGSRNGTLLNGRSAGRDPIRFGDRIQIGETVLLFSHLDPAEERIVHRQKLEAIGRLGAGISHDINNVLGGILVNLDFILGMGDARLTEPEVQEALADLRASAVLGADLTRRILTLAHRGSGEHAQIDLSALVEDALNLARRTFDRGIRIDREIAPEVRVRGDRAHLHQMLMNLLLNAKDALQGGGVLTVRLASASTADVDDMVAVAGHHVSLVVRDTGVGMNEETKARIFEPFFTTKTADKGSGLGLPTVMEVVRAHGGTITCESAEGKGTAFHVVLPALVATTRPTTHTPIHLLREQRLPTKQVRILVVDDDPVSRRSICRLLSRDGHTMLPAENGREALEILGKDPSAIDVVLMDLDMPDLDGQETQRRMRVVRDDVRIVFLTGVVEEGRKRELVEQGASAVLAKPCPAEKIRATIQDVVQRPLLRPDGA